MQVMRNIGDPAIGVSYIIRVGVILLSKYAHSFCGFDSLDSRIDCQLCAFGRVGIQWICPKIQFSVRFVSVLVVLWAYSWGARPGSGESIL